MSTNKINEFTKRFLDFEVSRIDSAEWEAWEAIRFDAYYMIRESVLKIKNTEKIDSQGKPSHRKRVKGSIKFVFQLLKFLSQLGRIKKNYLIFAASRFKDSKGLNYDPNILDIKDSLPDQTVIIDYVKLPGKVRYPVIYNNLKVLYNLKYKKKNKHTVPLNIRKGIQKEFGCEIDWDYLNQVLTLYYSEKQFYKWFLTKFRPRAIFITQNGIQKALFRVCRDLKIPVIEFQHGIIYSSHMAYTYPKDVDRNKLAIPNVFLLYSDFWKKKIEDVYPVDSLIVTGNSAASEIKPHEVKYNLTFICTSPFMNLFNELISDLLKRGYKGKICLKLHPHQRNEVENIRSRYGDNPTVDVVYTDVSIKDIIGMSENLLTIQSTSAYEVLDAGKRLFILKEMTYEIHSDIFSDPLVTLIDDSEELLEHLEKKPESISRNIDRKVKYFSPYKKDKFEEFLSLITSEQTSNN